MSGRSDGVLYCSVVISGGKGGLSRCGVDGMTGFTMRGSGRGDSGMDTSQSRHPAYVMAGRCQAKPEAQTQADPCTARGHGEVVPWSRICLEQSSASDKEWGTLGMNGECHQNIPSIRSIQSVYFYRSFTSAFPASFYQHPCSIGFLASQP